MIKQLQTLRDENLLNSDHYKWKETLWSLKNHPHIKTQGMTAPRHKISTYKYEHEKACAWAFVHLFLEGHLTGWELHKKLSPKIIPDRTALLEHTNLYVEVELSTRDRVSEKLANYMNYHRQTGEKFEVLFLVKQLREWEAPRQYQFKLLEEIVPKAVPNQNPTVSKGNLTESP